MHCITGLIMIYIVAKSEHCHTSFWGYYTPNCKNVKFFRERLPFCCRKIPHVTAAQMIEPDLGIHEAVNNNNRLLFYSLGVPSLLNRGSFSR